jgi:hypothetical protein
VKRGAAIAVACALGATSGCDLVAGLDRFHRAGAGGGAGGGEDVTAASASSSGANTGGASSSGDTSSSTGSSACANHLLLNEVQIQNDYVELYAPGPSPIDLSTYTIYALGGASPPMLIPKWDGSGLGATIEPGEPYLLAFDTGQYPDADDTLFDKLSNTTEPTVVILYDGSNIADSVCVCSSPANCTYPTMGQDLCDGRGLVSATFHDSTNQLSAGRKSCADTDDDEADFAVTCPTPGASNTPSTTCP